MICRFLLPCLFCFLSVLCLNITAALAERGEGGVQGQLVLLPEQQADHHLERGPARLLLLHSAHTASHQDKRGHQQSSTDPEIPSQPPATLLPNHKPPLPKRTQFKSMVSQHQLVVPPWKIATSLDNICDLKKSAYHILVPCVLLCPMPCWCL